MATHPASPSRTGLRHPGYGAQRAIAHCAHAAAAALTRFNKSICKQEDGLARVMTGASCAGRGWLLPQLAVDRGGPRGIRTHNPPVKSRKLCAIELEVHEQTIGGAYGIRTRDLRRDRPASLTWLNERPVIGLTRHHPISPEQTWLRHRDSNPDSLSQSQVSSPLDDAAISKARPGIVPRLAG